MLKLIRRYLPKQCLWRLLWPYYYIAIGLALIGSVLTLPNFMIVTINPNISGVLLFMLVLSWPFYVQFLANLMDKIDFERDICLIDWINLYAFTVLTAFYLILSLWGPLNILFYQVLREYGMKMLFTLYSMLLTATLTSTSIILTLGNWVISRRDREDGRLIAVVRFTRRALLFIFIVVFFFLLSVADLLVTRQTPFATCFLAVSLGLTITMAQTLVIMHALMDTLSEPAKPKGETKGPEHKVGDGAKVEGVKEGTGGTSKPQS